MGDEKIDVTINYTWNSFFTKFITNSVDNENNL